MDAAADEIGPVRIEALPEPRPGVGALILVSAVRPRDRDLVCMPEEPDE